MRLVDLTALVARVLGIIILLRAIAGLVGWATSLANLPQGMEQSLSTAQVAGTFALPILFALPLILLPFTIARAIVPGSASPEPSPGFASNELQQAGLFILGAYFIAKSIPDLIYNFLMLFIYAGPEYKADRASIYVSEVVTVIELVIGLVLALRAKGIVSLVERIRNAGHR